MAARPSTYAGLTIAVSAGVPATYDAAGFAALTYTDIGEVLSVGQIGREFTDVTYNTLKERGTLHLKGSFDFGTNEVQIGIDDDDAGQVLLVAAEASDDPYAFKFTFKDGSVKYFQSLVFSFAEQGGDSDTVRIANVNLSIDRQGIISVAAP
jgi:hypothetical protein